MHSQHNLDLRLSRSAACSLNHLFTTYYTPNRNSSRKTQVGCCLLTAWGSCGQVWGKQSRCSKIDAVLKMMFSIAKSICFCYYKLAFAEFTSCERPFLHSVRKVDHYAQKWLFQSLSAPTSYLCTFG